MRIKNSCRKEKYFCKIVSGPKDIDSKKREWTYCLFCGDRIIEGRKIYGNIIKYIKMTVNSNFGNMFSMLVVSAFLPMYPIQILMLNYIMYYNFLG